MPDPLTMTMLGSLVATEGIKFLFNQASELTKAWRERRAKKAAGELVTNQLDVPVQHSDALDAVPTAQCVDLEFMEREDKYLVELIGKVAPYAQGLADVEVDDANLAEAAGQLRAVLEAAYGQRFTFRGEDRKPTGTQVSVRQAFGVVSGSAVGAEADISEGRLTVNTHVQSVTEGGSVIGYKGKIG